jgi:hypothetical protein
MNRARFSIGVIAILVSAAQTPAGPPSAGQASPEPTLLVLRNGEVFTGRVTWAGDTYHVQTPGRQLTFPKANVLVVARDMADAFRQRRAALRPTDWQGHQELAAWCLAHQMLDEAALELDAADSTSPAHATSTRLRGNLEILRQRQRSTLPETANHTPRLERPDSSLDQLVQSLPEGSVGTFTKTIQPILVNGCAAAACHGVASKSDWRLLRINTRQAASRNSTLRNLESTLKLIDREKPDQSPLLTVPRAPHANAKDAIFNARNAAQFEQLTAWVNHIAGEPPNRLAAPKRPNAATAPASTQPNSKTPQAAPTDPFDPAAFNNSPKPAAPFTPTAPSPTRPR